MGLCGSTVATASNGRWAWLPAEPPTVVRTISSTELAQLLEKQLNAKAPLIQLADGTYGLYSRDDLTRLLAANRTEALPYKKESFDCDNFAQVLLGCERVWFSAVPEECGSAFGIVQGVIPKEDGSLRGHAMNYWVDPADLTVWLIEPQNDRLQKPPAGIQPYLVMG